jgi:hypothetical protein
MLYRILHLFRSFATIDQAQIQIGGRKRSVRSVGGYDSLRREGCPCGLGSGYMVLHAYTYVLL